MLTLAKSLFDETPDFMNLTELKMPALTAFDGDLPEGWTMTTLGKAFQINPPKPSAKSLTNDAPISFVPMPAVDANLGIIALPLQRPFGEVRSGFTAFADDDVIMAKITPCMENGKAAIARDLVNGLGFGSTEFHVFRPNGTALPEYVYYFIRQEAFRRIAESEMTGSVGQRRVPADFLRQAVFPLPPLAEQRRIVAKLEQLLAAASATRARLARVPILLKRFRQAVLAAACSGRLTADWRQQQPNAEPAAQLLERILAERREKWEAEGRKGKYQEPAVPDLRDAPELPDIPEEWQTVSFDQIAQFIQYGTSTKANGQEQNGIAMLRMGNIQDGKIDYTHLKYLNKTSDEISAFQLSLGDILFNRTNSPELVGKAAVYEGAIPAVFASYLVRLRCNYAVSAQLACYWINSFWGKEWAARVKTDGVSQSNINASKLSEMPFPLPPTVEQQEIVRRVEHLFRLADAIEKRTAAATARADRLTQSLLAKAFRGELVPTEAELARARERRNDMAF